MDCTEIHSEIYYSSYLDFCANKCCTEALECVPILSEKPIVVYLEICAHLMFYDPSNPYCTDCFSLLFVALKPVPASCLETRALALHMLPLSQARPLSCSCSLNNEQQPTQWCAPIP